MIYIISKLFTYLFLPPGIFIFILIFAAIVAKRFKVFFIISAIILYLISTNPISNLLLTPLENFSKKETTPAAVVVLGGGVNPNDKLHALPDAFKREIYGILLSKKENLPLIFSGGGKIEEAKWVKKDINLITSTCKCKIQTFFETKSKDTYENAKYTAKLFKKLNLPKKIYLVTNAYHMRRSYALFKHFGFLIVTKPVGFYKSKIDDIWDFFPSEGSFHKSYKAIHEYFGLLSLILRGIKT